MCYQSGTFLGRHVRKISLCIYWSVKADDIPHNRTLHDIDIKLEPLWPEAAEHLRQQAPAALTHATYRAIRFSPWVKQRAVWIGRDAAHGMSPQLGQGANLPLLDALALADAIQQQAKLTEALLHYERTRRAHTRWYSWGSHWLTPLFQSEYDSMARLRDLLFEPMSRLPVVKQIALKLLTGSMGL